MLLIFLFPPFSFLVCSCFFSSCFYISSFIFFLLKVTTSIPVNPTYKHYSGNGKSSYSRECGQRAVPAARSGAHSTHLHPTEPWELSSLRPGTHSLTKTTMQRQPGEPGYPTDSPRSRVPKAPKTPDGHQRQPQAGRRSSQKWKGNIYSGRINVLSILLSYQPILPGLLPIEVAEVLKGWVWVQQSKCGRTKSHAATPAGKMRPGRNHLPV